MKKTTIFILAVMLVLMLTACARHGAGSDERLALGTILARNALDSQSDEAVKVTDEDGSLSSYYSNKQVDSVVNGYYDGKKVTVVSGYDTLWESDFVFYLYNGSAYSLYPEYDDELLRYADLSGLANFGDGYPASQFSFLEGWSPKIVDKQESESGTVVVYEVTAAEDESFSYYFSEYDDIKPGTKLYFKLELDTKGRITAYSLSRDRACTDAVWVRYAYEYVSTADYDVERAAEFDTQYESGELVTISLVDAETQRMAAEIKIQKGAPFYGEISAEKVLYMDSGCTKSYLDYTREYTKTNGKQLAIEEGTVFYIGAK